MEEGAKDSMSSEAKLGMDGGAPPGDALDPRAIGRGKDANDESAGVISVPAVFGYVRSASGDGDHDEILRQESVIAARAGKLGRKVDGVFCDVGISGNTLDRKGLKTLLTACGASGPGTIVIVEELTRLARPMEMMVELALRLERMGIVVLPLFSDRRSNSD